MKYNDYMSKVQICAERMEGSRMETKQIFATRTKTLRKERGLSQTELAAALDISRTSVNLYESASRVPDITALARYASFFSVASDYLLGLSDDRATPEKLKKGWEIVISPDGDDTIAKLYKDGSLAQVDVVSRYYKDEYNMEEAAKEVVKKFLSRRGLPVGLCLWGKPQTTMNLREEKYISLPMVSVLTIKIARDRTIMQRH